MGGVLGWVDRGGGLGDGLGLGLGLINYLLWLGWDLRVSDLWLLLESTILLLISYIDFSLMRERLRLK